MKKKIKKLALTLSSVLFAASIAIGGALQADYSAVHAENNVVTSSTGINPTDMLKENQFLTYTANIDSPDYVVNGTHSSGTKTATKKDIVEYHHNGIKVDVAAPGTTIEFNNIFDISKSTADTPLLDWMPLVERRGTSEITQATLKVEDADNPNNYFCILMVENQYYPYIGASVYTQDFTSLGYRQGGGTFSNTPSHYTAEGNILLQTNFTGVLEYALGANRLLESSQWGDKQPLNTPFSFRYDSESQQITHYTIVRNRRSSILDIDDENVVGIGKGFKGFTNNRVKISLTIDKLKSGSTSLMFYNVLGIPLGGETLVDTEAPNYFIEYPNHEVPKAEVNKPYKIFNAEFYDHLCGICENRVYLREPNFTTRSLLESDSFTPTKAGTYILTYESIDDFGNKTSKDIEIIASYLNAPISITVDDLEKDQYNIGERISIPDYSVVGGVGAIETNVEIIRSMDGGNVKIETGNYFVPLIGGQYQIKYIAQDYIGTKTEKVVYFDVEADYKAVIVGNLNIQDKFSNGVTVKLPNVNAYDYYSVEATQLNAIIEIRVRGNGKELLLGEDRLFTPNLNEFGNDITIEYKVYCRDYVSYATIYTFNAKIVEAKYAGDYFSYDNEKTLVSYNYPTVGSITDAYIRFDALEEHQNAEIEFLNPLYEQEISFMLEVEYAKKNFEKINVKILDSENSSIGFEFDIRENPNNVTALFVDYMGTAYGMNGGFNTIDDLAKVPITLKYQNGVMRDYLNDWIFNVTHNIDGTKFEGFPSGYARVTFTIVEPTVCMDSTTSEELIYETEGAALIVQSICGQIFFASYDLIDGSLLKFSDSAAPQIFYSFDPSKKLFRGDTFGIPYAVANDIITPNVGVTLSVSSPNGNADIYNNVQMVEGLSFVLSEYGNYTITYTAIDAAGNRNDKNLYVSISDAEDPLICLPSCDDMQAKVDERISLRKPSVVDNVTREVALEVFVVDTTGHYNRITDYEYIPSKAGMYKVVYVARDEAGNVACEEVKLSVVE